MFLHFPIAPLDPSRPPEQRRSQKDFAAFESLYHGPPLVMESNNEPPSNNNSQNNDAVESTWTFPYLLAEQLHEYKATRPIDTLWSMPMIVFLVYDVVYNITHLNFGYLQKGDYEN